LGTILIVEDEAALRKVMERELRGAGHIVTSAVNGRDAIRLLDNASFDVVISDLIMPEADGFEVIRRLRQKTPRIPVILTTGGGSGSAALYLEMAKQMGAAETLAKPFTIDQLREAVDRLDPGKPG
jgi:CheY-like chemotaxis protein